MAKPIKIFELNGDDFLKGYSIHSTARIGGIFRQASNVDPFEKLGILRPTLSPTQVGGATIAQNISQLTGFSDGGLPYYYGIANSSKLYKITALSNTVTDVSSDITAGATAQDAIIYQGKYVYVSGTTVRANSVPVAIANDVEILTGLTASMPNWFFIGGDGNLYLTNGNKIARITNLTGTTGNTTNIFALETGMIIRDLNSDGRYLILVADTNASQTIGRFRSIVAFWNMVDDSLAQIYELDDSYTIGLEVESGSVYVFAYDNLYLCSVNNYPRVLLPFGGSSTITTRPTSPAAIIKKQGSIIWGGTGGIYAYGTIVPNGEKIFYMPYSDTNVTCLAYNGYNFWHADSSHALYNHFASSTRNQSTILLSDIVFPRPYIFAFARIVTYELLATGESLALSINSQAGNGVVTNNKTYTYAGSGSKQSFVFDLVRGSSENDVQYFDEFSYIQLTLNKVGIRKLEIFAYPASDRAVGE